MGKSTYWATQVINSLPATLYIALFESGVECSYSGYVRQEITQSKSGSTMTNTNDILFAADSAVSHTITEYRIYDASTAGNEYYSEVLGTSVSMPTNEQFEFKSGQVTVTEA